MEPLLAGLLVVLAIVAIVVVTMPKSPVASAAEGTPGADRIVPRIKSTAMEKAVRQLGGRGDDLPATTPFLGKLVVAYAFDLPGLFRIVSKRDLTRLAIDEDDLLELAVDNMMRDGTRIEVREHGPILQVVVGDHFDACAVLVDEFWPRLQKRVGGDLVVALPTRSLVLVCKQGDELAMETLVSATNDAYREGGTHALSRDLLLWTDDGWELLAPDA